MVEGDLRRLRMHARVETRAVWGRSKRGLIPTSSEEESHELDGLREQRFESKAIFDQMAEIF